MSSHAGVLIVGASAAGMATATALRRRGYAGRIRVLDSETTVPYDRPPLSKQFLAGSWAEDRLALLDAPALADLDVDLDLGTPAASLDTGRRVVLDADGHEHSYDDLVVATGLRPRRLPALSGAAAHVLRTLADARRLRSEVRHGTRVLIVGAGFIGLEAAATLSRLGAEVVVVDPVREPLSDRLGHETAARLLGLHAVHGVQVRTGTTVTSAHRRGTSTVVTLAEGTLWTGEVVVEAVGSVTNTDWLEGSDVPVDDGVVCDERSSAREHVWAAGDVARWWHAGYGRLLRVEHRTNATEHGQHVAAGILGSRAPYAPLPFFWTDHFDVRVQVAGRLSAEATQTLLEIEGRPGASVRLFEESGRLVGVLGWNAPREIGPYRRELLATIMHPEVMT
jgi:NADPH-dependent 2,4-dienoyl-CoA reductase/sulfur reductase-like enzyme